MYSIALSYSGTSRNINKHSFEIGSPYVLSKPKSEYIIFGEYSTQSIRGKSVRKNNFLHVKHYLKLSKKLKTFEFIQVQKMILCC